jgi:hypothetical protein
MALSVPNASESVMLSNILNKTSPEDLDIRLFTNSHVPTENDVSSDYTEASGSGYVFKQLSPANWTIVAGDPSVATYTQTTWVFTGALGNIYGYYVTRRSSGTLAWSELFSNGPYNIQNNGDEIKITPRLSLE